MKKIILVAGLLSLTLFACKKHDSDTTEDFTTTEKTALNDFVDVVAVPQYNALATKAAGLNTAINTLNTTPTAANLTAAKNSWLDMRTAWEQCEGFLFGPVEDSSYDPQMDTWPTDFLQMDSLLHSTATLNQPLLENITYSLRGFHPIEYILFGNHGDQTIDSLTPRKKQYMVALAADLQGICNNLATSWTTNGNFGNLVKTAGAGSAKYGTRKEVFVAMVDGLVDICHEVGTGKMDEPLQSQDAKTVESPYSGNSITDFKNNIIGLQSVYLCSFNGAGGRSLSDLVKAKNVALDQTIRSQITTAISSFDNITLPFEQAIFTQTQQVRATQAALATLEATLDGDLKAFMTTNIKD